MKRKIFSVVALASLVTLGSLSFGLTSCDGNGDVVDKDVAVSEIKMTLAKSTLKINETTSAVVSFTPSDATNKKYTLASEDSSVASIGTDNEIKALKAGKTNIVATSEDGKKVAKALLTVVEEVVEVSSIEITLAVSTLAIGETTTVNAIILPNNATDKTYTLTSGDSTIATVEGNVVTAVGLGTCEIIATSNSNNKVGKTNVTVTNKDILVESVELSALKTTISISETLQINTKINPENATNKKVIFSVDDSTIATISETGLLTPLKKGKVTVSATSEEGNHVGSIAINIMETIKLEAEKAILTNCSSLDESATGSNASGKLHVGQISKTSVIDFQIDSSIATAADLSLVFAVATPSNLDINTTFTVMVNDNVLKYDDPKVKFEGTQGWFAWTPFDCGSVELVKGLNTIIVSGVPGIGTNFDYISLTTTSDIKFHERVENEQYDSYFTADNALLENCSKAEESGIYSYGGIHIGAISTDPDAPSKFTLKLNSNK